jgi:hypothetical protein
MIALNEGKSKKASRYAEGKRQKCGRAARAELLFLHALPPSLLPFAFLLLPYLLGLPSR